MSLDHYRLLGRSGLRVSPLALGTMTFGQDWGWGADEAESGRILDAYLERGGNFIDTANFYTFGSSETLLGKLLQHRRERVVLATKYSLSMDAADPNAGGNHRRAMLRGVEASLKRLNTDYLDLLYLHAWDGTTPVEEVMRAFDDLTRAGKVMYAGISDTPAWQVARMQTLADLRGWSPLVALQIEYSLLQRSVEHDLIPMADALGLGVVAWSPLGGGVLTGKYGAADLDPPAQAKPTGTRREVAIANGALNARALEIAEVVRAIAQDTDYSAAQISIAWTLQRPGAGAIPIIGARTLAQLEDNLGALDVQLTPAQCMRLDAASLSTAPFPHDFLRSPLVLRNLFGSTRLRPRA
jgi:aryl-alcohol dehydrogenase-like predicted oxidoreductase